LKLLLLRLLSHHFLTIPNFLGEAVSISNILLNRMGLKAVGPTKHSADEAKKMRASVRRTSSKISLTSYV